MNIRAIFSLLLVAACSVLAAGFPIDEESRPLEGSLVFRLGSDENPIAKADIGANIPDFLSMDSHDPLVAKASVILSRDSAMEYFHNVPASITCVINKLFKLPMQIFQQLTHTGKESPVSEPC